MLRMLIALSIRRTRRTPGRAPTLCIFPNLDSCRPPNVDPEDPSRCRSSRPGLCRPCPSSPTWCRPRPPHLRLPDRHRAGIPVPPMSATPLATRASTATVDRHPSAQIRSHRTADRCSRLRSAPLRSIEPPAAAASLPIRPRFLHCQPIGEIPTGRAISVPASSHLHRSVCLPAATGRAISVPASSRPCRLVCLPAAVRAHAAICIPATVASRHRLSHDHRPCQTVLRPALTPASPSGRPPLFLLAAVREDDEGSIGTNVKAVHVRDADFRFYTDLRARPRDLKAVQRWKHGSQS